jgi:hypothetical protein
MEKKIQTKDEVLAEWIAEHVALEKKRLGHSEQCLGSARYAGPDRGFVRCWSEKTEIGAARQAG